MRQVDFFIDHSDNFQKTIALAQQYCLEHGRDPKPVVEVAQAYFSIKREIQSNLVFGNGAGI